MTRRVVVPAYFTHTGWILKTLRDENSSFKPASNGSGGAVTSPAEGRVPSFPAGLQSFIQQRLSHRQGINCAMGSVSWHPDNENLISAKVHLLGQLFHSNCSLTQANLGVWLGKDWTALVFPCFSARCSPSLNQEQEWWWDSLSAAFPTGARKYIAR